MIVPKSAEQASSLSSKVPGGGFTDEEFKKIIDYIDLIKFKRKNK